ncbi:hypothetical protein Skr01_64780 [Sphaerisporangium krabiense]|nr:hypothetical protein Skr01_64780 [Sphaerisporangium krabiense]
MGGVADADGRGAGIDGVGTGGGDGAGTVGVGTGEGAGTGEGLGPGVAGPPGPAGSGFDGDGISAPAWDGCPDGSPGERSPPATARPCDSPPTSSAGLDSRGQTGTSPGSPGRVGLARSVGDCDRLADAADDPGAADGAAAGGRAAGGAGAAGEIDGVDAFGMVGAEAPGIAGASVAADGVGVPAPCVAGALGVAGTPGVAVGRGVSTGGKAGSVPPGRVWSSCDSREGVSGKRSAAGPFAVLGTVWSGWAMAGDAGEDPAGLWSVPGQGWVLGVREAGVSSSGLDGPNHSCSPGNRSAAGHGCDSPRPHARRVSSAGT